MLRIYARLTGLALVCFGLAGFFYLLQLSLVESFFHAAVGLMFVYLGFWQRDLEVVRGVTGGLGVLLLAGKGFLILVHLLWRDVSALGPVELVCLAVGITSVLAARFLRGGSPPPVR